MKKMNNVVEIKCIRKSKKSFFLKIVFNNDLKMNCFEINIKLM